MRLFTAVLLLALALVAVWWQLAEKRARAEAARADRLEERLAALGDSLGAARAPDTLRPAAPAAAGRLDPYVIERLRRAGLEDPEHELLADLARHPELIPFKGVQGGTMRFYEGQSAVVSPEWTVGYFEDGHIAGRGVFEYRVQPGPRITWKRVTAKLD